MPKVASKKTGQNVKQLSSSSQTPQESEAPQALPPFQGFNAPQSVQDLARPTGVRGENCRKIVQAPSFELSVHEYVKASLQFAIDNEPNRPEWQNGIFDFARLLKSHPKLQDSSGTGIARQFAQALGEDWSLQLNHEGDLDPIDAEIEFVAVWSKIRVSMNVQPIAMAASLAKKAPLALDPLNLDVGLRDRMDIYKKFVSVCGWLCVVLNRTDISIPCEAFAAELGVTSMTISRLRNQAVKDGYMTLAEKHDHLQHKATTFHFQAKQWKPLVEQMALNKN